jgi:hypothetical protein
MSWKSEDDRENDVPYSLQLLLLEGTYFDERVNIRYRQQA